MMAAVIETAKRVLGAVPDGVGHARELVADAKEALAKAEKRQADLVARAKQAFDDEQTDSTADELAQAERRADIIRRGAREKVAIAEGLLAQRERAALDAKLAELDAIVASVGARVLERLPKMLEHLQAVYDLCEQADADVLAATGAHQQASRLRNVSIERAHAKTMGIQVCRGILRVQIEDQLLGPKLDRLRELIG